MKTKNPIKLSTERQNPLEDFNIALNDLKEEFHRTGRFDDANTKLDEITKLLSIKLFDLKNKTALFTLENLKKVAKQNFNDANAIAKALQVIFEGVSNNSLFQALDGTNVFGSNPRLNIQPSDNEFAIKIVNIINQIDLNKFNDGKSVRFDLLNEAFGHFVRDNFRNHKEDAQYMTPIETVDAMIDIALIDILKDPLSKKNLLSTHKDSFIVLDPTCGVGTFITRAAEKIEDSINKELKSRSKKVIQIRRDSAYRGQDKVDRMVRLAKINSLFSGTNPHNIFQGNSILGESSLDNLIGKVDLILTNPPFGAEFDINELSFYDQYEVLPKIKNSFGTKTLNSELIMLDKSLKLLKPGGRMLIVVPDGVVSAVGLYQQYREVLLNNFILKAVIDLPAVTFAQAGTRTKCSVVYIQKPYSLEDKKSAIFMGVANDIGYEVKERMGTPVKAYKGTNDLAMLSQIYLNAEPSTKIKILNENPSAVLYPPESLIASKWNANFYAANRIKVIDKFSSIKSKDLEIKTLKEVANSCTKQRKRISVSDTVKCISVLHVKDDSMIQIEEVLKYNPLYPGNECLPGEILFSKINPRIPRVAVIPDIGMSLTCSTEFEILQPNDKKHTYLLRILLLTDLVQKQINSLTSGTSSSHNRIKEAELMNIQLPWPRKGTKTEEKLLELARVVEQQEKKKYESNRTSKETIEKIESLIGI